MILDYVLWRARRESEKTLEREEAGAMDMWYKRSLSFGEFGVQIAVVKRRHEERLARIAEAARILKGES